jgi:AGZA family xanthine/uracil permease-like MFS transporter
MPFTYSIAYGLIAGILSYIILNGIAWILEKVSGGRIVPPNKDESDPWSWKVPGGFLPPWVKRAASGRKDFWRRDEERAASDELESIGSSKERVAVEKGLNNAEEPATKTL